MIAAHTQLTDRMREAPRYRCRARLSLFDPAAGGYAALETHDVSIGGAFVPSSVLLDEGTRLTLMALLPSGATFPVEARVVRTSAGGQTWPPGMGLRFVSISADDARRLVAEARALLAASRAVAPAG